MPHAPAAHPIELPFELIAGFGAIAERYDLILCDIWGVLHNGLVATRSASATLTRFREAGGRVVLITNAPRPGGAVLRQLDRLAVPRAAFDAIVTSGDMTRHAIAARAGEVLYHLGPERDLALFRDIEAKSGTLEEADYVVCTGLRDDRVETVETYRAELARLSARGLPMVCANPDLVVERGHLLVPCAGALALAYEEQGGEVFYAGKPHRPIYEASFAAGARLMGDAAPERVLAIGDAIRTDIAGAVGYGIDSLFLARGIHAAEIGLGAGGLDETAALAWFRGQEARPRWFAETLAWG